MTFEPEAVAEFLARIAKKGLADELHDNGISGSGTASDRSGLELPAQLACDGPVEQLPSASGTRG
jgi:hypothetical protein